MIGAGIISPDSPQRRSTTSSWNVRNTHCARDEIRRKLGSSNTHELAKLVETEEGTKALLNFLDNTKRFRDAHRRLWVQED